MKRFGLLLLTGILLSVNIQAKEGIWGWFHLTPKVGFGSSLLLNEGMLDHDDVSPKMFNPSFLYGVQVGMAFFDMVDLSVEYAGYSTRQTYMVNLTDFKYDKTLKMNNSDLGVFLKYMGNTGYFEVGGAKSSLNKISVENHVTQSDRTTSTVFNDQIDYFKNEHYEAIIGFGASLVQADLLEVTLGVRVRYGFQPIAIGNELPLNDGEYDVSNFSTNSNTNDLTFMIDLSVHNFFGFFGRAVCGGQSVVFFKKPKKLW